MRKMSLLIVLMGLALAASADTLQLKNGMVVQGKYLGGSERALQFEVNGNLQTYPVSDLLSLTFTGAPPPSAVPSNARAAAASPQANSSAAASDAASSGDAPQPNPATAGASARSAAPSTTAAPQSGAPSSVTVPAGTRLTVRMIDSVDSNTSHAGDRFRASLEEDLVANGLTVAPKGAKVQGRLAEAQSAGRITGKPLLTLELTDITIQGRRQPVLTGEYELAGDSRTASTARRAGGGAAAGAIIGAIAGGGKGAAIGAGVGAGAGTATNAATEAEQVGVPSETVIEFRLSQPFTAQLR